MCCPSSKYTINMHWQRRLCLSLKIWALADVVPVGLVSEYGGIAIRCFIDGAFTRNGREPLPR